METAAELEDYLSELLDGNDPRQRRFIDQLLKKWRPPERTVKAPTDLQAYRKEEDPSYVSATATKGKKKNKKYAANNQESSVRPEPEVNDLPGQASLDTVGNVKGKTKFVPLFGERGQLKAGAKLPGRHPCECQASMHKLVSNCLGCGRVVCEQEGSGPCLFCASLVCTPEELEMLSRGSKKSEKLRDSLVSRAQGGILGGDNNNATPRLLAKIQAGLVKAQEHKDKLLHYDRTSQQRTKVIDDESDYFTTDNKWLSEAEREALRVREEELRVKRHGSRVNRKVTLDFAGRQVIETQEHVDVYNVDDDVIQAVHFGKGALRSESGDHPAFQNGDFSDLVNPHIVQHPPQFVPSAAAVSKPGRPKAVPRSEDLAARRALRIQDKALKEMSDDGMCMSMHQPWASLLVHGIKVHEGRTWYTSHRGRLYIAATSREPSTQEVAELEDQYRLCHNGASIEFPHVYPVSCLLGSVDVTDCLSQEEYREKHPSGESDSPYVFICQHPQQLLVKFPLKGRHKIYKLHGHVHKAAKKGLHPSKGFE